VTDDDLREGLLRIWLAHRPDVDRRVGVLDALAADAAAPAELREEARRAAHGLAGSLGMYGFGDASAAALAIERTIVGGGRPAPGDVARLRALIERSAPD
jgi:chemotaxis protein histidine kinase CheA